MKGKEGYAENCWNSRVMEKKKAVFYFCSSEKTLFEIINRTFGYSKHSYPKKKHNEQRSIINIIL